MFGKKKTEKKEPFFKPRHIKEAENIIELCKYNHMWGKVDSIEVSKEVYKHLYGCGVVSQIYRKQDNIVAIVFGNKVIVNI